MIIYRVIRGECKCYMACNSYKIHDVEKIFWEDAEVYILQKNYFWTTSMKFLPMGEGSSSAMSYNFTHYLSETLADKKYVKILI